MAKERPKNLVENRCSRCGTLLCKANITGVLEIKCKCGTVNTWIVENKKESEGQTFTINPIVE